MRPEIPYNQLDGEFTTVGGSEPAYNLSTYLQTAYKNNRDVTFITGPLGPGEEDLWMTGYIEGTCAIEDEHQIASHPFAPGDASGGLIKAAASTEACTVGKVSYLGGHSYNTDVPLSTNADSQGTRLFLNALFEADCVTSIGQPNLTVAAQGVMEIAAAEVPQKQGYTLSFSNEGSGIALDAVLTLTAPNDVTVSNFGSGTLNGNTVTWDIGTIGGQNQPANAPPTAGSVTFDLSFGAFESFDLVAKLTYRVGLTSLAAPTETFTVTVALDSDGDGVPDDRDPAPNDPNICGDSDNDLCDDCAVAGSFAPLNDGPDQDADGLCDALDEAGGPDGSGDGCDCRTHNPERQLPLFAIAAILYLLWRRRRLSH